jgi:hypothetical protein
MGALKDVEWLRPRMGQFRSIMNNMSNDIGEIGSKCVRDLAVKDT